MGKSLGRAPRKAGWLESVDITTADASASFGHAGVSVFPSKAISVGQDVGTSFFPLKSSPSEHGHEVSFLPLKVSLNGGRGVGTVRVMWFLWQCATDSCNCCLSIAWRSRQTCSSLSFSWSLCSRRSMIFLQSSKSWCSIVALVSFFICSFPCKCLLS